MCRPSRGFKRQDKICLGEKMKTFHVIFFLLVFWIWNRNTLPTLDFPTAIDEGFGIDKPLVSSSSLSPPNNNDGTSSLSFLTDKPLRIAFVGDSLSRYMYLSLAYYLKFGVWAPRGHQLLEKVKDTSANHWNDWLNYTNGILKPQETCDCYRYWESGFQWKNHCENRYFRSGQHSLTFITKFGQYPFHGHWNPSQVFQRKHMNMTRRPYRWSYESWSELIETHIQHLQPKPDYIVFNQAHCKSHELRSVDVLKDIQTTLKKVGIVGIYRTTTFRRDEMDFEEFRNFKTRKHDAKVCRYFPCLNVSWTAQTPPADYVDDIHFTAPINNQMNQQLLEFLHGNPQPFDNSTFFAAMS